MTRPRHRKSAAFPPYLYAESHGGFRFTLVNGRRIRLTMSRAEAIAIANEYNCKMRASSGKTLEYLMRLSKQGGHDSSLGKAIPALLEQICLLERPRHSKLQTLKQDSKRSEEFFKLILATDITLEHVNEYLTHYHRDVSNNVYNRK